MTTSGVFTQYAIPTAKSLAAGIASGADGNLWFTEPGSNKIGRVTTTGSFTEFAIPTGGSLAAGIAPGPDGNLWFTEPGSNKVARVTSGLTTTNLSSSANPSVFGQGVTLTATVTANTPEPHTPTGTVTFEDGSSVLGTGTLNSSGQATLAVSNLAVGAQTITAAYGGDSSFVKSTSAPLSQQVGKDGTTTALSVNTSPSFYDQAVTFTATVGVSAPGAGVPTGAVDFYDGATDSAAACCNWSAVSTKPATSPRPCLSGRTRSRRPTSATATTREARPVGSARRSCRSR